MIVRLALPVSTGVLRLHAEKGRQWSPIEHLLLNALCDRPASAAQLAEQCSLPVRVAIEVLIRLMRAGWAELRSEGGRVIFQATKAGAEVVGKDKLPANTRPIRRRAGFAYDLVCGAVFRTRDLTLYSRARLTEISKETSIKLLECGKPHPLPIKSVISRILNEDEDLKGFDTTGEKLVEKFALVTFDEGKMEGLPSYCPEVLRGYLVQEAGIDDGGQAGSSHPGPPLRVFDHQSDFFDASFNADDFIIGGEEHLKLIESALRGARQRILIHSTFISDVAFSRFVPLLHDAARRFVHVDVLLGLSVSDKRAARAAELRSTIARCLSFFPSEEVRARIRFHTPTTDSHAKLLVFDNGRDFYAAVGSCNWLSSDFNSFEVSALCRDPRIVSRLIDAVGRLDQANTGHWTQFTRELAVLSSLVEKREPKRQSKARVKIVFGAEHNSFVTQARDEAVQAITLGSHRIGKRAFTQVLLPANAAADSKGVAIKMYYGKVDDGGERVIDEQNARSEGAAKVRFVEIFEPRMHAKFLAWDDDYVVITSQNWLSADPSDSHPLSEVGIFLQGTKLAFELLARVRREFPE